MLDKLQADLEVVPTIEPIFTLALAASGIMGREHAS